LTVWRGTGKSDEQILEQFLDLTDSSLHSQTLLRNSDSQVKDYAFRIHQRLLPREVYSFVASRHSHAEGGLLSVFIKILQGKDLTHDQNVKERTLRDFNQIMGEELRRIKPTLGRSGQEALWNAGAWLDAPGSPKFENINFLIGSGKQVVHLSEIFPINYWIQAYESHRYAVRVFSFSEHLPAVHAAARIACERLIGAKTDEFYETAERKID
jgi:hypothetical protein